MKKMLLISALATGGVSAVQVNDLAPDFDNMIADNGFWVTTGHNPVEVAEASSDPDVSGALDSLIFGAEPGAIALFDSRETTSDESDGIAKFSSKPVGTIINLR